MGLPCSHRIQERLVNDDVLHPDDIHPHWHLKRAIAPLLPIDPRLQVVDPLVICPRGRPQGARGRNRAENSTQRDLSAFEVVEGQGLGQGQRQGRQRDRGGRGGQRGGGQRGHRGQAQGVKQSQEVPGGHFGVFNLDF